MSNLSTDYKLSLYDVLSELSVGKIYIVKNSLDDRVYIKKILKLENHEVYTNLKKIKSPNLPLIYEILEFEDHIIVIEEYINGVTLDNILEKSETFPESDVIDYALDLCEVLELLHSGDRPIVHRDIKPSNIIINNDGILKLIDFDVSRTHKADESTDTDFLGTYGYAAPEQFGFGQSDYRTDIYSLGVTMNVLLTKGFPVNNLYSGSLSNIISKCTRLDPNYRFQSISELKKALLKKSNGFNRINSSFDNSDMLKVKTSKLPGFRGNRISLKVLASLWYILLISISLGFFTEDSTYENRLSDVILVMIFLALTLLYGNYLNIKSAMPMIRSENIFLKYLGYLLYTLIILLILGIFIPT